MIWHDTSGNQNNLYDVGILVLRIALLIAALMYDSFTFIFMPPPFEEWCGGIKCYPCPSVRACVRPSVRPLQNLLSAQ